MQIQKLNPIGYQAKTEKGNTYKKSNMWTSAAVVLSAIGDVPCIISPKKAASLSLVGMMGDKIPERYRAAAIAAEAVLSIAIGIICGRFLDKNLSARRAAKADSAAAEADKTIAQG